MELNVTIGSWAFLVIGPMGFIDGNLISSLRYSITTVQTGLNDGSTETM